ncbi:hypothetical protein PCS_01977 [Desulfocurvibacter africanus PCS]|uniref:Uncharacterized protein n=1 Tax=Desulfocurvibacter africanus PCS TaxID=1262666 RepID=M5Q0Z9_DESAF|nr:hypothetical protein PCS_01977 [Desulfocurvibacter africanus PCS]
MKRLYSDQAILSVTDLSRKNIGWDDRQELIDVMFGNLFDILFRRKYSLGIGRQIPFRSKVSPGNEDALHDNDIFTVEIGSESRHTLMFYTSSNLPLIFCKVRRTTESNSWSLHTGSTNFMLTWFEAKGRSDSMQSCVYVDTTEFLPHVWVDRQARTYPNFNVRYDVHNLAVYYSLACLSDCLDAMGSSLEQLHLQIQGEIFHSM